MSKEELILEKVCEIFKWGYHRGFFNKLMFSKNILHRITEFDFNLNDCITTVDIYNKISLLEKNDHIRYIKAYAKTIEIIVNYIIQDSSNIFLQIHVIIKKRANHHNYIRLLVIINEMKIIIHG